MSISGLLILFTTFIILKLSKDEKLKIYRVFYSAEVSDIATGETVYSSPVFDNVKARNAEEAVEKAKAQLHLEIQNERDTQDLGAPHRRYYNFKAVPICPHDGTQSYLDK